MLRTVTWRMVLRLRDRTHRVLDLRDVAELRAAIARARADPEVTGWRYWRLLELAGRVRSRCPRCAARFAPGQVSGQVCRCGLVHVRHRCRECRLEVVDPPRGAGCGPVPFDPEAANARYRRRRRGGGPARR
jgi:hypothetical protein